MRALRAASGSLATEMVEVLRRSETKQPDGEGGFTYPTVVAAIYSGRRRTMSARELEIAGRMTENVDAVITLPHDAEIRGSDTLRVGGKSYRVSGVMEKSPALSARLDVMV